MGALTAELSAATPTFIGDAVSGGALQLSPWHPGAGVPNIICVVSGIVPSTLAPNCTNCARNALSSPAFTRSVTLFTSVAERPLSSRPTFSVRSLPAEMAPPLLESVEAAISSLPRLMIWPATPSVWLMMVRSTVGSATTGLPVPGSFGPRCHIGK
ncbi:hypothetical protein D3C87_1115250 [compost metagenome]